MQLLYFFEGLRRPWLDGIMLALTTLGDEIGFLALTLILFWCVDKRRAYYLMSVGFIGTVASQLLKILCRIPRPWVRDPDFTIVEAARAGADGYSFPSGHSQSSVGTFGSVALTTGKKWLRAVCVCLCVLIPVSRMYLGVHTPQDVLVGSALSLALLLVLRPVILHARQKELNLLFAGLVLLAAAYTAYVQLYPFPADIDPENLAAARKNACTLLGAIAAMAVVCLVDGRWLHFSTQAPAAAQIIKAVGGLVLTLAVKEGLRWPLEALFAGHLIARSIRYAAVVLFAGLVWPMCFPGIIRMTTALSGRKPKSR